MHCQFRKAAELSPKDVWVLQNLALTYEATRDYAAADRMYRRAAEIAPETLPPHIRLKRLQVIWKGDLAASEAILANLPPKAQAEREVIMAWVSMRVYQRRYDEALALLEKVPREKADAEPTQHEADLIYLGMLHQVKGDAATARPILEKARQQLQQKITAMPDYAKLYGSLSHVLAYLGDRAGTINAAERAMQLLPQSVDAFDGPMIATMAAQAYATIGERDRAFALIEHLLTIPNGLSVPTLRLDPMWDPLRDDPRFEQLLLKHAPRP